MPQVPTVHPGGNPPLGKFWTLPNVLSLFRIVVAAPVAYLILKDGPILWILTLCLLAIASDYFDGRVARWSHSVSEWGKVLDPLADKLGGGMVVLALVIRGSLPIWFVVLVLVRDLLIFFGGIWLVRRTGHVYMSLWSGKAAMTGLAITALAALLRADTPVLAFCIWATTALLVYSFLRYVGRYIRVTRQHRQLIRETAAVEAAQADAAQADAAQTDQP